MFASPRDYILIANFVGMALVPFLLLAALNFKLYATIKVLTTTRPIITLFIFEESGAKNQKRTHRQKRDRQIASLLILLVIVFGSCNIVRVIFLMMEWWCDDGGYYGEYAFLLHPGLLFLAHCLYDNSLKRTKIIC